MNYSTKVIKKKKKHRHVPKLDEVFRSDAQYDVEMLGNIHDTNNNPNGSADIYLSPIIANSSVDEEQCVGDKGVRSDISQQLDTAAIEQDAMDTSESTHHVDTELLKNTSHHKHQISCHSDVCHEEQNDNNDILDDIVASKNSPDINDAHKFPVTAQATLDDNEAVLTSNACESDMYNTDIPEILEIQTMSSSITDNETDSKPPQLPHAQHLDTFADNMAKYILFRSKLAIVLENPATRIHCLRNEQIGEVHSCPKNDNTTCTKSPTKGSCGHTTQTEAGITNQSYSDLSHSAKSDVHDTHTELACVNLSDAAVLTNEITGGVCVPKPLSPSHGISTLGSGSFFPMHDQSSPHFRERMAEAASIQARLELNMRKIKEKMELLASLKEEQERQVHAHSIISDHPGATSMSKYSECSIHNELPVSNECSMNECPIHGECSDDVISVPGECVPSSVIISNECPVHGHMHIYAPPESSWQHMQHPYGHENTYAMTGKLQNVDVYMNENQLSLHKVHEVSQEIYIYQTLHKVAATHDSQSAELVVHISQELIKVIPKRHINLLPHAPHEVTATSCTQHVAQVIAETHNVLTVRNSAAIYHVAHIPHQEPYSMKHSISCREDHTASYTSKDKVLESIECDKFAHSNSTDAGEQFTSTLVIDIDTRMVESVNRLRQVIKSLSEDSHDSGNDFLDEISGTNGVIDVSSENSIDTINPDIGAVVFPTESLLVHSEMCNESGDLEDVPSIGDIAKSVEPVNISISTAGHAISDSCVILIDDKTEPNTLSVSEVHHVEPSSIAIQPVSIVVTVADQVGTDGRDMPESFNEEAVGISMYAEPEDDDLKLPGGAMSTVDLDISAVDSRSRSSSFSSIELVDYACDSPEHRDVPYSNSATAEQSHNMTCKLPVVSPNSVIPDILLGATCYYHASMSEGIIDDSDTDLMQFSDEEQSSGLFGNDDNESETYEMANHDNTEVLPDQGGTDMFESTKVEPIDIFHESEVKGKTGGTHRADEKKPSVDECEHISSGDHMASRDVCNGVNGEIRLASDDEPGVIRPIVTECDVSQRVLSDDEGNSDTSTPMDISSSHITCRNIAAIANFSGDMVNEVFSEVMCSRGIDDLNHSCNENFVSNSDIVSTMADNLTDTRDDPEPEPLLDEAQNPRLKSILEFSETKPTQSLCYPDVELNELFGNELDVMKLSYSYDSPISLLYEETLSSVHNMDSDGYIVTSDVISGTHYMENDPLVCDVETQLFPINQQENKILVDLDMYKYGTLLDNSYSVDDISSVSSSEVSDASIVTVIHNPSHIERSELTNTPHPPHSPTENQASMETRNSTIEHTAGAHKASALASHLLESSLRSRRIPRTEARTLSESSIAHTSIIPEGLVTGNHCTPKLNAPTKRRYHGRHLRSTGHSQPKPTIQLSASDSVLVKGHSASGRSALDVDSREPHLLHAQLGYARVDDDALSQKHVMIQMRLNALRTGFDQMLEDVRYVKDQFDETHDIHIRSLSSLSDLQPVVKQRPISEPVSGSSDLTHQQEADPLYFRKTLSCDAIRQHNTNVPNVELTTSSSDPVLRHKYVTSGLTIKKTSPILKPFLKCIDGDSISLSDDSALDASHSEVDTLYDSGTTPIDSSRDSYPSRVWIPGNEHLKHPAEMAHILQLGELQHHPDVDRTSDCDPSLDHVDVTSRRWSETDVDKTHQTMDSDSVKREMESVPLNSHGEVDEDTASCTVHSKPQCQSDQSELRQEGLSGIDFSRHVDLYGPYFQSRRSRLKHKKSPLRITHVENVHDATQKSESHVKPMPSIFSDQRDDI